MARNVTVFAVFLKIDSFGVASFYQLTAVLSQMIREVIAHNAAKVQSAGTVRRTRQNSASAVHHQKTRCTALSALVCSLRVVQRSVVQFIGYIPQTN